jgi:hypothetical protein
MQHHVFALTFDGALNFCPAGNDGKPLRRVLDAGTGTGIWAIDFGMPRRKRPVYLNSADPAHQPTRIPRHT